MLNSKYQEPLNSSCAESTMSYGSTWNVSFFFSSRIKFWVRNMMASAGKRYSKKSSVVILIYTLRRNRRVEKYLFESVYLSLGFCFSFILGVIPVSFRLKSILGPIKTRTGTRKSFSSECQFYVFSVYAWVSFVSYHQNHLENNFWNCHLLNEMNTQTHTNIAKETKNKLTVPCSILTHHIHLLSRTHTNDLTCLK